MSRGKQACSRGSPTNPFSDNPVIVSLELHVSLEQQEIMVEIMQEIWAGLLVDRPGCGSPVDDVKLPTPGELRRKILVKVKNVSAKRPDQAADSLAPDAQRTDSVSSQSSSETDASSIKAAQAKKPPKIIEGLSKLGVYTRSFHFSHFKQPGMTGLACSAGIADSTQRRPSRPMSFLSLKRSSWICMRPTLRGSSIIIA